MFKNLDKIVNLNMPKLHFNSKLCKYLLPKRFVAITLGSHIFIRDMIVSGAVIKHELVHVQQWKKYTWKFPFLYLYQSLIYGYDNNKFEVEARNYDKI